jgi:hypothetical protein
LKARKSVPAAAFAVLKPVKPVGSTNGSAVAAAVVSSVAPESSTALAYASSGSSQLIGGSVATPSSPWIGAPREPRVSHRRRYCSPITVYEKPRVAAFSRRRAASASRPSPR